MWRTLNQRNRIAAIRWRTAQRLELDFWRRWTTLPPYRNLDIPKYWRREVARLALMFPPNLFVYAYLFESGKAGPHAGAAIRAFHAARAAIPSAVVCLAAGLGQWAMTPKTYDGGATSAYLYRLTQPSVILHYVKQFFPPTGLSVDTESIQAPRSPRGTRNLQIAPTICAAAWNHQSDFPSSQILPIGLRFRPTIRRPRRCRIGPCASMSPT